MYAGVAKLQLAIEVDVVQAQHGQKAGVRLRATRRAANGCPKIGMNQARREPLRPFAKIP